MRAEDPRNFVVHAAERVRARDELRGGPQLHRIRRGSYLPAEKWGQMYGGERHLALVYATAAKMRTPLPTFSFYAAAALWHLPIIGQWPPTVDVTMRSGAAGSSNLVKRHRLSDVPPADYITGLPVTSAARTVVDLARTGSVVSGVVTADAALRNKLCTLDGLLAELETIPARAAGRRNALTVVGLAQRIGSESLSRARMFELGFPQPDLQVPLHDGTRVFGFGDFGWGGLIGEFDGRVKYRVDGYAQAGAEDAVWREKLREDAIRRTHRVVRWVCDDAIDPNRLSRVLGAAGLDTQLGRPWLSRADGVRVR